MIRRGWLAGSVLAAMCLGGCGQSEEARRVAELEARLAAVDERIQATQAEWKLAMEAMRMESAAPTVVETAPVYAGVRVGFLGTTGMSFGSDFDWQTRQVLAEGAATIRGKVLADARPRAGVRLRLLLSGIRSAWTTSDSQGFYVVRVPPGKYRYQGFELDHAVADSALSGMLQQNTHDLPVLPYVEASPEKPGVGPEFAFVAAVTALSPLGRETLARNRVRLAWEPYPGAAEYEVSLMESDERGRSSRGLVNQPPLRTSDTFLLVPDRVALSAGKVYSWSVTAFNARGDELSRSPEFHRSQAAFKVE